MKEKKTILIQKKNNIFFIKSDVFWYWAPYDSMMNFLLQLKQFSTKLKQFIVKHCWVYQKWQYDSDKGT